MDKELIYRLACAAGGRLEILGDGNESTRVGMCFEALGPMSDRYPSLERFAALIAEECAKECEARGRNYREARAPGWFEVDHEADQNAHAIRAKFKVTP